MSSLKLVGVSQRYRDNLVLDDIGLNVAEGEFVTLLGPSGCGKTTCLRLIAGFQRPTAGRIIFGEDDVTALAPYRRGTGVVFQSYALFPHLTVAENVGFGLKVQRLPRSEAAQRVSEVLGRMQLEDFADRYPLQLSGGQKQRVALARAIVIRPRILLLDEPLSALDLKLRESLQIEIRAIQRELGITAIFVTHDQGEALGMSDRVAVMRKGRIEQIGSPVAIYKQPETPFVANFVGRTNFVDVSVKARRPDAGYEVQDPRSVEDALVVPANSSVDVPPGEEALLAFRPEAAGFEPGAGNSLPARVDNVSYTGENWLVLCGMGAGRQIAVRRTQSQRLPAVGEMVRVYWPSEDTILFKKQDGWL